MPKRGSWLPAKSVILQCKTRIHRLLGQTVVHRGLCWATVLQIEQQRPGIAMNDTKHGTHKATAN